jgi:hypothetical protein
MLDASGIKGGILDDPRMLPVYEEGSWMNQGCFQDTRRHAG